VTSQQNSHETPILENLILVPARAAKSLLAQTNGQGPRDYNKQNFT